MYAKATRNFLKEDDAGGNLIAVSNLNDSDKLQLLSLVTKKKRYWCWQRPKYQFLSVTLGDVLTEDQFLSPGMFLWFYLQLVPDQEMILLLDACCLAVV